MGDSFLEEFDEPTPQSGVRVVPNKPAGGEGGTDQKIAGIKDRASKKETPEKPTKEPKKKSNKTKVSTPTGSVTIEQYEPTPPAWNKEGRTGAGLEFREPKKPEPKAGEKRTASDYKPSDIESLITHNTGNTTEDEATQQMREEQGYDPSNVEKPGRSKESKESTMIDAWRKGGSMYERGANKTEAGTNYKGIPTKAALEQPTPIKQKYGATSEERGRWVNPEHNLPSEERSVSMDDLLDVDPFQVDETTYIDPLQDNYDEGAQTIPEQNAAIENAARAGYQSANETSSAVDIASGNANTPGNPYDKAPEVIKEAFRRASKDMKGQSDQVFGEWGTNVANSEPEKMSYQGLQQWLDAMGQRQEEYTGLRRREATGQPLAEEEMTRLGQLKAYYKAQEGLKSRVDHLREKERAAAKKRGMEMDPNWLPPVDMMTDDMVVSQALVNFARSLGPMGKAIIHALEQSAYADFVHEIAPIIRKAMIDYEGERQVEVLVKSMEAEKASTNEMSEMKKSLDEIRKALDAIPELKKSLDILLKDSEDYKDILIWYDDRLTSMEKAKKDHEEPDGDEPEEDEEMKKYAEGVPKSPNGMSSDTDAPVKKGKENDIKQTIREDAKLEGAKPQKLTGGGSSMTPHKAEEQKLVKSFEEGKKAGEIEAIKKMAEVSDTVTPNPGSTVEANRSMEPLAKSDNDLVNMPWGKIERLYREGKL